MSQCKIGSVAHVYLFVQALEVLMIGVHVNAVTNYVFHAKFERNKSQDKLCSSIKKILLFSYKWFMELSCVSKFNVIFINTPNCTLV